MTNHIYALKNSGTKSTQNMHANYIATSKYTTITMSKLTSVNIL